ncbi:RNA-dependent RNA polymerase 6 [Pyrus ussuriensis x Pyrus communis]|uniref:RNA-dependent RNA polymerase 6 n=1 Tax=Pyrus ussuriensis x Pyrus communis TaxID=2448454 RepID=A0A5N5HN05_9ROSA|nr:RNA-dependent RNA polymerase 6 [Pyrus ussuriensis x Pyrus communis]
MVNENLGVTCNSHVVHADHSDYGSMTFAVDFSKTGKTLALPEYHTYKSTQVLGRLCRHTRDAYDEEVATSSELNYAPELLNFIASAWEKKCSYDGQPKGLMGQYKVKREKWQNIVIGHVWSIPKSNSKKQGKLECIDYLTDDEKNILYEQKASTRYQVTCHPKCVKGSMHLQEPDVAGDVWMLSFTWIAANYHARIKIKRGEVEQLTLMEQ